jgi:hypothetical protein
MYMFSPSVVRSQLQSAEFPPPQALNSEQPRAAGVKQVGAKSVGAELLLLR